MAGEVSYRMTANRYGWTKWGIVAEDVKIAGEGIRRKK